MSDRAEKCPHCGYSINAEHSPYPSIEEATEASAGIPMQEPIETIVEPRKKSYLWIWLCFIAIAAGIGFGVYYYAYLYKPHCGADGEYINLSKEQLLKLADKNDLEAMTQLGINLAADQDYTTAFEWFKKAGEQGYAKAQSYMGICYQKPFGVEKNPAEAFKWFKKAAEQGYAEAQYNMGICYQNAIVVDLNSATLLQI